MKQTIFILGLLFFMSSANAATSGYYSSASEISAIVNSEEVARKLGTSRKIDSIIRFDGNFFDVKAGDCRLTVEVTYVTPASSRPIGRGEMVLDVHDRICSMREI